LMGVGGVITHTQQDLNIYSVLHLKLRLNFTKQKKTFLLLFFKYFCKKYQMLAPWNGSHRKKGSGAGF